MEVSWLALTHTTRSSFVSSMTSDSELVLEEKEKEKEDGEKQEERIGARDGWKDEDKSETSTGGDASSSAATTSATTTIRNTKEKEKKTGVKMKMCYSVEDGSHLLVPSDDNEYRSGGDVELVGERRMLTSHYAHSRKLRQIYQPTCVSPLFTANVMLMGR